MKIFSSKKYKNFHVIVLEDDRMYASRISNVLKQQNVVVEFKATW